LQRGEKIDVEKVLGTGVPEKEMEWQEGKPCSSRCTISSRSLCRNNTKAATAVLNELEKEDLTRSEKKKQVSPAPSPKVEPAPKQEPAKMEQTESTSHEGFF
jgi:hypothetical protein